MDRKKAVIEGIFKKISFKTGSLDLLKYCEEEWANEASREASTLYAGILEHDPFRRQVFQYERRRHIHSGGYRSGRRRR